MDEVTPYIYERLIADMMIWANVTEDERQRETERNLDNLWRDPFMGLSLLCKRKSYYMENLNAHFVW